MSYSIHYNTKLYLKNIPLLTKEELREFAIFVACASSPVSSNMCDEYYEGLLRLVSPKLLKEPNEPQTEKE